MEDPYAIETSSDEEFEVVRKEYVKKKQEEKTKGKGSQYRAFVPEGVTVKYTVQELESFKPGNYTPLTGPPSEVKTKGASDKKSMYGGIDLSGGNYGSVDPTQDSNYGAVDPRIGTKSNYGVVDPNDSNYGGITEIGNYGGVSDAYGGLPMEGKGNYGTYSAARDILVQREELSKLTAMERDGRVRYEGWKKNRETADISIFSDKKIAEPIASDAAITRSTWWNKAFISAQEMPERTPDEVLAKYRLLSKLSTDFIEIAKVYGRTVILEYFLKRDHQTISTMRLGGVAGGTKYIVRGILFKLAIDPQIGHGNRKSYVYGGATRNYEYAAKAAGHELKGAINMHKYYSKDIYVPMQALVDFHGYRLVAMPLLPLKGGKLIYGSKDTGTTIHHDDERFNQCMKEIAEDLHLAGHEVRDGKGVRHHIYCAGDVEGHIGSDGRYYLIDLARAFPPESFYETRHLRRNRQAVFFRMLRPEFLQWLKKNHRPNKPKEQLPPLSCDALTNWGQGGKDAKEHNNRVREATSILVSKVIPEFANIFEQKTPRQLRDIQVSEELHRHGINVRHMGLVRFLINGEDESSDAARRALLVSMVGRTLKNLLRREMRVEHDAHKKAQPSDHDSRAMVVEFLNLVTYANPEDDNTKDFWEETVPFGLMKRFGQMALSAVERENLFASIKDDVVKIVKYVVSATGVQVQSTAMRTLEETGAGFEFVSVDLGALTVRIKHMSIIDYATAKVLSQEAYQGGVGIAGDRLLSLARRQFNRTLQSDPLNDVCKSEASITRLRIVARKFENRAAIPGLDVRRKAQYFMLSDEKLFQAATVASRQQKKVQSDSDDLASMIRAILTTWTGRRRGKQADLFRRCGGASHISYVRRLIKFVESTRNRLLTLELCAFLATCRDATLVRHLRHFVKEIATKTKKEIETQGIPPMEIKQASSKQGSKGNSQQHTGLHLSEELVHRLVDKLWSNQKDDPRKLVVLSNLLAATGSPEFWMQGILICQALIKEHKKDAFFRWYRGSPWNLVRSQTALRAEESAWIANVIMELSPLYILDLRGLKIKNDRNYDRHVQKIAGALSSLPDGTIFAELKSNHTLPVQKLRANELEEIDFKQMTKHDVVWLFALLINNRSVQRITISHTDLDLRECEAICKGIKGHTIREFTLRGCDIDDRELKCLCGELSNISKLEVLRLPQNIFTDQAGSLLGNLKSLTELDLSKCAKITDATVRAVADQCKSLRSLDLSECSGLTDNSGVEIAKLTGLERLFLKECKSLTDKAFVSIAKGCPDLTHLDISSCVLIGDGALRAIGGGCKKLEILELAFCKNVTDASVVKMAEKFGKSIKKLGLGHCSKLTDKSVAAIGSMCRGILALDLSVCSKITDDAISEIAKGCHDLKELNLGICEKITDQSLIAVAESCKGLEVLNISCCDKVTDEAITKLTNCPDLRDLNLYSCKQVTGASVKELATKCKKLKHMDLFWCEGIKQEAIEALMKNLPECQIDR